MEPRTSRFSVGPVVSWPLLNLGRVRANENAAAAERDAAEARYEQTVRRAGEEIRSAVVRYRSARARLTHLEARVRLSDPRRVIERGFALIRDAEGRIVTDAGRLRELGHAAVEMRDGTVTVIPRGDEDDEQQ